MALCSEGSAIKGNTSTQFGYAQENVKTYSSTLSWAKIQKHTKRGTLGFLYGKIEQNFTGMLTIKHPQDPTKSSEATINIGTEFHRVGVSYESQETRFGVWQAGFYQGKGDMSILLVAQERENNKPTNKKPQSISKKTWGSSVLATFGVRKPFWRHNWKIVPMAQIAVEKITMDKIVEKQKGGETTIYLKDGNRYFLYTGVEVSRKIKTGGMVTFSAKVMTIMSDMIFTVHDKEENNFALLNGSKDRYTLILGARANIPLDDKVSLNTGYALYKNNSGTTHNTSISLEYKF